MHALTRPASLLIAALVVLLIAGCIAPAAGPSQVGLRPPQQGAAAAGADQFAGAPEGTATVDGAVQRISIDVAQGYYDPTIAHVEAGVPVEIVFGQGQGCLARVQFPDFGLDQDLTQCGATVKLPAMKPGEYEFHCGMSMVYGKVVAR
jgi:hypothetical protein